MKISIILHEIGDAVKITEGDFSGMTGVVVGWGHIGSGAALGSTPTEAPDVSHVVKLDEPANKTVENSIDVGGGVKHVKTESVTFHQVEVPSSYLHPSDLSPAGT